MKFSSISCPVLLACSDGNEYVVKGNKGGLGRANSNDQMVGRLATAMGAPVPPVTIVQVAPDLTQNQPDLHDLPPGLAHGSRYMPDSSNVKQGIAFQNVPENRPRFAALAVMYGWATASDHQFFYQDGTSFVLSFDHGHFFPGGPNWTIQNLQGAAAAAPDATIVNGCQLQLDELTEAKTRLGAVTNATIAAAVASPPAAWGMLPDERVEMALFLERRRDQLLA